MNKFLLVCLSLHGMIFVFLCPVARGRPAQPLLQFNAAKDTYELNRNFVADVAKLPLPIRVIAMHGDPRIGKSTILNTIIHVWKGANHSFVEEIFKTGDSVAPVTRGVWAYITQTKEGSYILLEVETADQSDNIHVAQIQLFMEMISSCLIFLVREHVQNSNLQSLFILARRNELIFPYHSRDNFPKLHFILRGGLKAPGGRSVENITKDFIAGHSSQESMVDERKTIAKYFPWRDIAVSEIPHVNDRGLFKDFEQFSRSDYVRATETLAREWKEFPIKRTLEGSPMDGVALAELIERLAEAAIGSSGWQDFASVYDIIESNICKRSEAKLVAPVFKLKSDQIESEKKNRLDAIAKECQLEDGITSAKDKLQRIYHAKKELEDLEITLAGYTSKKMEEIERREKSEEEFQKRIAEKDKEITEETKSWKKAEDKAQELMEKLNSCECLLKAEMEKELEIPVGAELLYGQTRKKKEETHCSDILVEIAKLNEKVDELTKLEENQKRIIAALEKKFSIQEFYEAFIKAVGLLTSIVGLANQIRAYRQNNIN